MIKTKQKVWFLFAIFSLLSVGWLRVGVAKSGLFSNEISHICIGNIDIDFKRRVPAGREKFDFKWRGDGSCSMSPLGFESVLSPSVQRNRVLAAAFGNGHAAVFGYKLPHTDSFAIQKMILSLEKAGYTVVGQKQETKGDLEYVVFRNGAARIQLIIAGHLDGDQLAWIIFLGTQGVSDE